MADESYPKPFDGGITRFYEQFAPEDVRSAISNARRDSILNPSYPYRKRWSRKKYDAMLYGLQVELGKLQTWVKAEGARIAVVIEGRDAAGKGGTIKRFREFMNPRGARVVALGKPSDQERSQWFFQRYILHLPNAGEIVFFDRSWYNRGVIDHVFGFCRPSERERFFDQVNEFEHMIVSDGICLVKIWLNIGRAEQLRRFLDRESDRLKHWKLSKIDVAGLYKWDEFTAAIRETFERSDSSWAPWRVILGDDKRRARVAAIQSVLDRVHYPEKDVAFAHGPDPKISVGTRMFDA